MSDPRLEKIMQLVDELIAPEQMGKDEAKSFLEELEDEVGARLSMLEDEMAEALAEEATEAELSEMEE